MCNIHRGLVHTTLTMLHRARAWTANIRNIHKCNGYLSFSRAPMFVCNNLVKILTPRSPAYSLSKLN